MHSTTDLEVASRLATLNAGLRRLPKRQREEQQQREQQQQEHQVCSGRMMVVGPPSARYPSHYALSDAVRCCGLPCSPRLERLALAAPVQAEGVGSAPSEATPQRRRRHAL